MTKTAGPCLRCQRIRAAVWMLAAVGVMALLPFVGFDQGASAMGTKPIANPVADAASAVKTAAAAQAEALASAASAKATGVASATMAKAGGAVASAAGGLLGTVPASAGSTPAGGTAAGKAGAPAASGAAAAPASGAGFTTIVLGVPPPAPVPPSAPAAASAPSTATELIYDRLILVRLALNQPWKGLALVKNVKPAYTLSFDPKALPPGLAIGSDAWLRGLPTAEGRYDFVLRLSGESRSVDQRYRIEVFQPLAKKAAPPASGVLTTLPASARERDVDEKPAEPRTWRLTAENLKALTAPTTDAGKGSDSDSETGSDKDKSPPLPPAPTVDQLTKILTPLEEQEYPTESMIRHAIAANVCSYYLLEVRGIAQATNQVVDETCPPLPDGTPAPTATRRAFPAATYQAAAKRIVSLAAGREPAPQVRAAPATAAQAPRPVAKAGDKPGDKQITLAQFHAQLMPDDVADEIVRVARKRHPISNSKPLQLAPMDGCGCNPATNPDEVYGMFAYWHGAKDPQVVDFGLFTRIAFVGALLDARGGYNVSYEGDAKQLAFVREAHNRNVAVDLVVYRRDWSMLRRFSADDLQKFIADAAEGAVRLAQSRMDDTSATMQRMLIPPWREPPFTFDGITLFFDEPSSDPADAAAFQNFLYQFVPALAEQMQRSKRAWKLNVVVPDHRLGEKGTYSIDWLWRALQLPETAASPDQDPGRIKPAVSDEDIQRKRDLYQSKGQHSGHRPGLSVQFLVLLSEPTTDYKKQLRARLDWSEVVKGDQRVEMLRALVPVLLTKRDGAPDKLPEARGQFDDDLAYMSWNFSNLALWPMPVAGQGRGDGVRYLLDTYYGTADTIGSGICAALCPLRVWMRLLLQTLMLLGAVAVGLYFVNCDVRKLGTSYRIFLFGGGAATALVSVGLLSCDPDLESWRRGNVFLYAVMLVLFVYGAWRSLKPKEVQP